jgi:hypothetical protein
MSLLVACTSFFLQRRCPGLLLRVPVSMKQSEESSGAPSGLISAALITAFSLILVSCRGYIHSVRPGVPPNQELISPTVTILPAGTPVHVRLLQSLNTHKSEVIENVPFQVITTVRVGDFTVIERGASATGRAYVTSPDGSARTAQIYLVLGSTKTVTEIEIPLSGILNEERSSCGAIPEILCGEGGHVAVGDGTEIEAFVAEDVALSTPELQTFAMEKRRRSARQIADRQLRMRVQIFLLPADGTAQTRVFFDGRKIGKVGPGENLTLLPSPGKHVIAVNDDRLALELAATGQYYVRVSETGSCPRTKAHLKLVAPDQGQYEVTDLVGVPADQH